jgi:cytidyltransferase-like protein
MILYTDMVGDIFHYGHSEYLRKIYELKKEGDKLFVGIHNDETVQTYKRLPVLNMQERVKVISCCKYIDKIIENSPLSITKEFIHFHKIDLIFTPDNRTEEEMQKMMKDPFEMGIVRKIPYTHEISTTDIIKRIKSMSLL